VVVEDIEHKCRIVYCGVHASIGRIAFGIP
jgi:hypothetical protein